MNSEELQTKLDEATARETVVRADLEAAKSELTAARDEYSQNPKPATLAKLKANQSAFDALSGVAESVARKREELRADLEAARICETREGQLSRLETLARQANEEYSAFIHARKAASDEITVHAQEVQGALRKLMNTRREFVSAAGELASDIHMTPNMAHTVNFSAESRELRADLEKRVGDLSGLSRQFHQNQFQFAWSEFGSLDSVPFSAVVETLCYWQSPNEGAAKNETAI